MDERGADADVVDEAPADVDLVLQRVAEPAAEAGLERVFEAVAGEQGDARRVEGRSRRRFASAGRVVRVRRLGGASSAGDDEREGERSAGREALVHGCRLLWGRRDRRRFDRAGGAASCHPARVFKAVSTDSEPRLLRRHWKLSSGGGAPSAPCSPWPEAGHFPRGTLRDSRPLRERAPGPAMEDLRGLNYKPVRVLGEGSHGVVLLVEHTRLGKPFVMKVIQQKFLANKDVVGRFIAEAQRGAKLNHDAFAPIVDLGETLDGRTYFVMEYVDGVTLLQALRERGALRLDQALVLGLQLLDGLAAAHDAHLIHRDIKPANLFLTTRGRLKILDLGISKSIIDTGTGPNTAHGVAIGTPKYMSPEQAKGQPVSFAADLYAVALVLFEMLTGDPAFDAPNAQELLRQHIYTPPPTLAQRSGRPFPPALEELIACALRKNPAERFQTAREMQTAVHAVLESTRAQSVAPISAPRSTPPPPDDGTVQERARPTVKVDGPPPSEAFPTAHVRVATALASSGTDPASTRPISADALVLGSASTDRQTAVIHASADPTARTEALVALTDAQPVETGGATTRTHDESTGLDTVPGKAIAPSRPLLVVAATMGGLAVLLASIAALVLVVRSGDRGAPAVPAASAVASHLVSASPPAPSIGATMAVSAPAPVPSTAMSASTTPTAQPPASGKPLAIAAPAKPKPTSHYQGAVDALNAGDLETADAEARLAVAGGGGTQAQLLHAQILERRGKKAGAREVYRQILEKDPTMAAAVAGLKRCGG
ncbi:MAG: protein kinase [Deltaproteobacteria bacterium]|nr:protein kinase [Deltaproteobacteria bacterium]